MSQDVCLIHGKPLHYDKRSGFDICYECEREREPAMTDSGADALRLQQLLNEWNAGDTDADVLLEEAFKAGCASQKRRDAAIARHPYCAAVDAIDGDKPSVVGEKIARAIEAGDHT